MPLHPRNPYYSHQRGSVLLRSPRARALRAVSAVALILAFTSFPIGSRAQTDRVTMASGFAFNLFADPMNVPEFSLLAGASVGLVESSPLQTLLQRSDGLPCRGRCSSVRGAYDGDDSCFDHRWTSKTPRSKIAGEPLSSE
jgi:hypothetical protein